MGFRFRKSFGKGPFRINISKSGIGYSFGVKGARITKTAKGTKRTTLSVPGTGLSYISETSGKRKKNRKPSSRSTPTPVSVPKSDNNTNTNTKGTSNPMKSVFSIIKKILLWALTIIFLSGSFVYFPSLSSIFAFILIALILPIQKWQNIISKVFNGKIKIIIAIILAIAMIATIPKTEVDKNAPLATVTMIVTPSPAPTATPKTTDTPAPSASPTAKPTATPTKAPRTKPTTKPTEKSTATTVAPTATPKPTVTPTEVPTATAKPTETPTSAPNDTASQRWVWVSANGTKYHSNSNCSNMKNPKKVTYDEAIELGYEPCKRCN